MDRWKDGLDLKGRTIALIVQAQLIITQIQ